ncbi:hypothetical protein DESPIG_00926 [Desulfovibrio piger ATCC 29098]|uniref:Uncharacterized protein n=1 Tax=Desulfovibrio piger ATCC 29098 TaxID=411464 RepID=B6WS80_9BACT|nr:hypothetical protein DESPIG_00926 [Desulfovibrio piger ATCC 29098]
MPELLDIIFFVSNALKSLFNILYLVLCYKMFGHCFAKSASYIFFRDFHNLLNEMGILTKYIMFA